MRRIRNAARANKIYVSLGYSEVDLASLYLSQVLISPTGDILNHRRKIRATHVERLIFGDGTGDTTESVTQTEIGRVGQLNCWENMNPFMKAYAASLGEQVHVAAWPLYPGKETLKYPDPFTNVAEANADVSNPSLWVSSSGLTAGPAGHARVCHRNGHFHPGPMADHHRRRDQAQHAPGQGAGGSSYLQRPWPDLRSRRTESRRASG
jgi:cyanide hydratase